jgi:hypothetical protein
METAKVDIRKLQTLNDCINRTIEALNQVRLSVHGAGLSHSGLGVQGLGVQGLGVPGYLGFQTPFGSPFASPFGIANQVAPQQIAAQQIAAQMYGVNPAMTGIGHTAATAAALGAFPNAFTNSFPNAFTNQFANAYNPFWTQTGLGLGHTAGVQDFTDPYVTTRIAQTFPFVHWGYSPFNWNNWTV